MSAQPASDEYPQLRERIADEVREAVLDAVRMAHRSLLGPEWDADRGVDEDGFDALYTHAADAVLDALGLEQVGWLEAPPDAIARGDYDRDDFDPHVSLGGCVMDYGDGPFHAAPVYRLRAAERSQ